MTDPQTPATEAGRRHILRFFSFADHEETDEAERDILAIEAEARAAVYRQIGELSELHAEAAAEVRREAGRDVTAGSDWAVEQGDGEGGYVGGFDAAIAFVMTILDPETKP